MQWGKIHRVSMYGWICMPEQCRIVVNRLRLGSHYLKIETGRWSRIPLENRMCTCNFDIQTEEHVLLMCPLTEALRTELNIDYNTLN